MHETHQAYIQIVLINAGKKNVLRHDMDYNGLRKYILQINNNLEKIIKQAAIMCDMLTMFKVHSPATVSSCTGD